MKEVKLKSFEFAKDSTKQLITLSTLLIAISITFFESFNNNSSKWLLIISWILLFISLILGVVTLLALTGTIGEIENDQELDRVSIYSKNITTFSKWQIISFILGVLILIIYSSFSDIPAKQKKQNEIKVKREIYYEIVKPKVKDTINMKFKIIEPNDSLAGN